MWILTMMSSFVVAVGVHAVETAYLLKEERALEGWVELERAEVGIAVQLLRGCAHSAEPFHWQRCISQGASLLRQL